MMIQIFYSIISLMMPELFKGKPEPIGRRPVVLPFVSEIKKTDKQNSKALSSPNNFKHLISQEKQEPVLYTQWQSCQNYRTDKSLYINIQF